MSVYPPSGSGNSHMDQSISGKSKKAAAKKAVAKAMPVKKAAKAMPIKATKAVPPKKGK